MADSEVLLRYIENHLPNESGDQAMGEQVIQLISLRDELAHFRKEMMFYECALLEIKTKLDVLDKELSMSNNRSPIESVKMRIKTPSSIYEKLTRKGIEFSVDAISANLEDVAGIRVVSLFIDDIYAIRDYLLKQDDIKVIQEKDYIKNPKDNGYRSLHLIIEIPIFLSNEKKQMHVEVQLRTIAMDFWASVEHHIKYKKNIKNDETVTEEMKYAAELMNQLDKRMMQLGKIIDKN